MADARDPEVLFWGLHFYQTRHGNKGYARDPETGEYIPEHEGGGVHMGYAWYYRCVELPRLVQVIHIMHPLSGDWEEWHVDGEKCEGAGDAIDRLNAPPLLTLAEYVVLERIGEFPCERSWAVNVAAGAHNPKPNFISGRWSEVSRVIDSLVAKGILGYIDGKLVLA